MELDPSATVRWENIEADLVRSQRLAAAGEFAASIMHEINNPLEAISNLSYIVSSQPDLSETTRGYMSMLEEQLALVRQIVAKTLGFAKTASTRQVIDLADVLESAFRLHERKISSRKIRVAKRILAPVHVKGHPGELLQVISNLITNSIDALPVGGTLHLRIHKGAQGVHVTIADSGHGIPSGILPRIFDSFFTTKQENGTGLGLRIAKTIIERHGGRIRVRTSVREGRSGTAFRISFPR